MAVWIHKLPEAQIRTAVGWDVKFTHGLRTVTNLVSAYCAAIHYLLNNPDDSDRREKSVQEAVKEA